MYMNENTKLQVTKLDELRGYARGQLVELPPFAQGQPMVVRLTRPSLLVMVKEGRIPNSLLKTANKLFMSTGDFNTEDNSLLNDMYGVMEEICKASMVEPTYDEVLSTGLRLTDDQMMAIFNYSQQGVKALQSFRKKSGNTGSDRAGKGVSKNPGGAHRGK